MQHLGRQVVLAPELLCEFLIWWQVPRETEVDQPDSNLVTIKALNEYVFQIDVSMNDLPLMQVVNGLEELPGDVLYLPLRHALFQILFTSFQAMLE